MDENLVELEQEVEETVINIEEAVGWAVGDATRHDSMVGRNDSNQHEIKAIEGLSDELKLIKTLQTRYSDKLGIANYYLWDDKQPRNNYGYFVSLASADTVKICNGNVDNVFGVTVNEAGFVGGQSEVIADNLDGSSVHTYTKDETSALVATTGLVVVRCSSGVAVGDCVVAGEDGVARKTETAHGYKVVAIHDDGTASIMLGVQADTTDKLSAIIANLDERLDAAEAQILMAINLAQQAMDAAEGSGGGSGGGGGDIPSGRLDDIENSIEDLNNRFDNVSDRADGAYIVATEAKEIANNAVSSAEDARDEAVTAANNALTETSKLRGEFEQTSKDMSKTLNDAVADLETLSKDLEPLASWPSEENPTGIAGFVARADEDSATLASVTKFEGEFGTALSGFINESTNENATIQAIASYQQKDENGDPYGPAGAAALIGQVDANKASIDLLAELEGEGYSGLAGLVAKVDENSSAVSTLASHVVGEFENVDDWVSSSKDTSKVYYDKKHRLYYYYKNGQWKGTSKAYEAGLVGSIAGVQNTADSNSAQINSLVSWQGKTNTSIARIEQKADANGAYIHSTVANIDKYAVGPHSQAYGFTLEQTISILEEGMIYVPTENVTEEYLIVSDQPEKYVREFDKTFLYAWGRVNGDGQYGWITVDKDYSELKLNTSNPSVFFSEDAPPTANTTHGYWYKTGENSQTEYEPYTLYKWDAYKYLSDPNDENSENEEYQWIPVATLAGNSQSRAVSQLRQDANSIEAEIVDAYGAVAGFGAKLSETEANVHSIASWPTDGGTHNMAVFEQKADDSGSYMTLAAVRNVDGNSEVTELSGAKIVLADTNDDESFIQLDADRINLDTKAFTVRDENEKVVMSAGNGQATIGGWTADETTLKSGKVGLSSAGDSDESIRMYAGNTDASSAPFKIHNDGSVYASKGNIGGWEINDDILKSGKVGLSSAEDSDDPIRMYAGNTSPSSAPFKVTNGGKLTASNADIEGRVVADKGNIGGWEINAKDLSSANNLVKLNADSSLTTTSLKNDSNSQVVMTAGSSTSELISIDDDDYTDSSDVGHTSISPTITYEFVNLSIPYNVSAIKVIPDGTIQQGIFIDNITTRADQLVIIDTYLNSRYGNLYIADADLPGAGDYDITLMVDNNNRYVVNLTTYEEIGGADGDVTNGKIYLIFETATPVKLGPSHMQIRGGDYYTVYRSESSPSNYISIEGRYEYEPEVFTRKILMNSNAIRDFGNLVYIDILDTKLETDFSDEYIQIEEYNILKEKDETYLNIKATSSTYTTEEADPYYGDLIKYIGYYAPFKSCTPAIQNRKMTAQCTPINNLPLNTYSNMHRIFINAIELEYDAPPYQLLADGSCYLRSGLDTSRIVCGSFELHNNEFTSRNMKLNENYFHLGKTSINSNGHGYFNAIFPSDNSKVSIAGDLLPYYYTGCNLGSSEYKWGTIYAKTGTINTSDRNEKIAIADIGDKYSLLFDNLKPISYKFKKNESNRTHIGFIAQDVEEALTTADLTTQEFAGICSWDKEDGTKGYGLRYEEFIALAVDEIQKLKKRVEELENKLNTQQND